MATFTPKVNGIRVLASRVNTQATSNLRGAGKVPPSSHTKLMCSASSGYRPSGDDVMDLHVLCLDGEGCTLKLSGFTMGLDVYRLASKHLPPKKGGKLTLHHLDSRLELNKTLQEQGVVGEAATLSCTYVPTDLYVAWCSLHSLQEGLEVPEELVLEGITQIAGTAMKSLHHLPLILETLTFGPFFNENLEGVTLPSRLQSLTFGEKFNKSLKSVALPSSLQSLAFGSCFNQSLEEVNLPSSLQSLTFGAAFDQSLRVTALPNSLQSLTLGSGFNQTLEDVTLPNSLQSLAFGHNFNKSLKGVTLPNGLQTLTFGSSFNQNLEEVALPSSLKSLAFGHNFNRSLKGVALPDSLQTLAFGSSFN